jgi:hypothetical protein
MIRLTGHHAGDGFPWLDGIVQVDGVDGSEVIVFGWQGCRIGVMFTRIHAEERDVTAFCLEFFAEIGHRDGFSILQWIRKLLAKEEDLHVAISGSGVTKVGKEHE